jgi:hypothetical protein
MQQKFNDGEDVSEVAAGLSLRFTVLSIGINERPEWGLHFGTGRDGNKVRPYVAVRARQLLIQTGWLWQ